MDQQAITITHADISAASANLNGVAHRTPVLTSRQANEKTGANLFFKCENFQRAGAFKFRGAFNAISHLSAEEKKRGVIAFSSGNHAQGIAVAARMAGVPATIVMPHDAPAIKLAATREYGAEVVLYQRGKEDRVVVTERLAIERGLSLIPPFDHPHIIAGAGTATRELIEDVGPLDYLFVCMGGGGLVSGSAIAAAHWSPGCIVIGVEPEAGDDGRQSLHSKKIVEIALPDTIADGAKTQRVGDLVFPILLKHVTDIVTVTDDQLRGQMKFFMERMKIVVEPTGCLAAAAAMSGSIDLAGKRVGIIISGGNVDPVVFAACITAASAVA